ncbi:MAG TPA: hypothetical protein VE710_21930 [Candidatus Bathyarchaeia archaeon]|nr:hypothetical protein [Candidatus Bathyarchaeia archaeon]
MRKANRKKQSPAVKSDEPERGSRMKHENSKEFVFFHRFPA